MFVSQRDNAELFLHGSDCGNLGCRVMITLHLLMAQLLSVGAQTDDQLEIQAHPE